MEDFVTREEFEKAIAVADNALLQLMGNRQAIVVAMKAIIRHHPQPELVMQDLLAATNPATFPDTWPNPLKEGFQGAALELLQESVTTGVQAQAQGLPKN